MKFGDGSVLSPCLYLIISYNGKNYLLSNYCWPNINLLFLKKIKSKSNLHYTRRITPKCDELRGPSPRLSAWATQLRRNVAAVASRWRHCVDLTGPGIEPQTSRTDSVRLATELTAGHALFINTKINEFSLETCCESHCQFYGSKLVGVTKCGAHIYYVLMKVVMHCLEFCFFKYGNSTLRCVCRYAAMLLPLQTILAWN